MGGKGWGAGGGKEKGGGGKGADLQPCNPCTTPSALKTITIIKPRVYLGREGGRECKARNRNRNS